MNNPIININSCDWQPLDDSQKIARYYSYKKLKHLFKEEQLYFRNCDLFEDDNERKRLDRGRFRDEKTYELAEKINNHIKRKFWAYVSCWTQFPYENAALWKIYDKYSSGACVVTSVGKLQAQLGSDVLIGNVMYEKEAHIPWVDISGKASNYLATEFVKIEPYFFEKEIRAVFFSESQENGLLKEIDIKSLVDEVYLSPFAGEHDLQQIRELLSDKIDGVKIKPSVISERKKQ